MGVTLKIPIVGIQASACDKINHKTNLGQIVHSVILDASNVPTSVVDLLCKEQSRVSEDKVKLNIKIETFEIVE